MTGIIQTAEDVIQAVAPEWTTVHVVPRGVPRFVDQNLRGVARYINRIGSFLPNIQPDNRVSLAATAQALSQDVTVDRIVDGMVPGCLIQIDEREIQLVFDVLRETNTLQTLNLLKSTYAPGVTVDLFGEPFVSTGQTAISQPHASLTVTQGTDVVILTARSGGLLGNRIRFSIVAPSTPSSPFALIVTDLDIVVSLETDPLGVPTTQFQQIVDTLNSSPASLVNAVFTGNNADIPTAYPLTYLSGGSETTTIGVRGRFPVLVGDQLWIQSDPQLLLSGTNYTVMAVQGYSTSLSLVNTIVVLDNPIPRDLEIDDIVYLRGFPAYRSNVITIPPHRRLPHPIGPFVVDYVSGRFTDGQSPTEVLSLQTFDGLDAPIDNAFPVAVPKNQPVLRVPIHQSAFLFFHRYRGTITYRNNKFVFRNDDRGRCEIWADLVPAWPAPLVGQSDLAWTTRLTFKSANVNAMYYQFEPNEIARVPGFPDQLLAVGSGGGNESKNVIIGMHAGQQPATRLRIITSGEPNGEIEMDGWNAVGTVNDGLWQADGQQAEKLQYGIVARQIGAFDWQAGSLQIKPYFKTLADLYTQMDVDVLDGGTLML